MQQVHQQNPINHQTNSPLPTTFRAINRTTLKSKIPKLKKEPLPTPRRMPSRGGVLSRSKKNKEKEPQVEKQKRIRNAWTQDEELLLAECFIQVSEDPNAGVIKSKILFWYKIQNVYNRSEEKASARQPRFISGVNDNDWDVEGVLLRSRLMGTDEEPEHFGDDELPRPPGLQRLAKSQRSGSNSTASSGSNPAAYQEFMAEQYELDRKAN
ncbi:hypothetical protein Tco_1540383 [Tanacetum coccineum]